MTTDRALGFRLTALSVVLSLVAAALPLGRAQAALVATEQVLTPARIAAQRAQIKTFLQRAEVQARLLGLGVSPAETEARLAGLADEEVARIADQLDRLPAGQGFFETAILAGVFIFI